MSDLDTVRALQCFEVGKKAVENQNWLLAVKSLRKAVVLEPGYADAYPLLIQAALEMKHQRLVAEMIGRVAVNMPEMIDDVLLLVSQRSETGSLHTFRTKPSIGSMAQDVCRQVVLSINDSQIRGRATAVHTVRSARYRSAMRSSGSVTCSLTP